MPHKFYITTPIYYVNAKPHIGHAYTTIAADVLARYKRLLGDAVFFLTGTDEHGAKIQQIADRVGKKPKEFVDEISAAFSTAWDTLNISNDNFIRTTDPAHERVVAAVTQELFDKKFIYKGKYEALYCVGCEQYKTKVDLVDGKCPDHKCEPEVRSEEAYLFKMSKFQDELLRRIKGGEFKISPEARKNEVISFYEKEGLKDVAISRKKKSVSWGIELPFDKNHTLYVWIDAFLNYLTGLGWPKDKKNYKKFWPADVQLMSKDILRVHSTIWPAMLLALDEELPKQLFVHGFFTIDGQKMSKTLGNVIDPNDLIKEYGSDGARYLIISQFPFGQDGDIKANNFTEQYNTNLANNLGNLVSRVLTLAVKSEIKNINQESSQFKIFGEVKKTWQEIDKAMAEFRIDMGLTAIWDLINYANKYIDDEKPWKLMKSRNQEFDNIIYNLLESLRHIAWMISFYLPETSNKIFVQLGILDLERKKSYDKLKQWGGVDLPIRIKKSGNLFPRA
jgi:methionyl-tRNA synthetase